MAANRQLEFFLLRYVPDAVKDEFVNIGVVMVEAAGNGDRGFAQVRFTRDWRRVRCLDPGADVEMLEALEREIVQGLQTGGDARALLARLEDSYSNLIQVSEAKGCLAEDPAKELEVVAGYYLETAKAAGKRETSGRQRIFRRMQEAFQQAGVWDLMRKQIPVAAYTHKGDPLKIDCGYRPNGEVKLFHAVSLGTDPDIAKVLAFSFPKLVEGIARKEQAMTSLTAVVEDTLDRVSDEIGFALAVLEQSGIGVAPVSEIGLVAERARLELKA
jgi:hypothetical protein